MLVPAAWAQDEQNVIEVEPAPLGPPTLLLPDLTGEKAVEPPEAEPAQLPEPAEPTGFDVDRLAELHPESMGTLDGKTGAPGPAHWRGSDRAQILRLLPRLPVGTGSPAARDLLRRLVLSPGAPGSSSEDASAPRSSDFLATRTALLLALGGIEDLSAFLALVPTRYDDEFMERVRVQGRMLSGDISGACPAVRAAITDYADVTFWRQALVICQLAAGENDQAALGLDLLREGGESTAFAALAEPLGGAETPGARPAPLDLALLQVTRQAPSLNFVERADYDLLPSLARDSELAPELRLQAAERAVAAGALDPRLLAKIYDGYTFPPESLNNAITLAPSLPRSAARALLYQVAKAESDPTIRAEVIKIALEQAAEDGRFLMAARLYAPMLGEVSPSPALLWLAGDAGRVFFAMGRYETASAWLSVLTSAAPNSSEARRAADRLWLLARLAGYRPREEAGGADGTPALPGALPGLESPRRVARYLAALQGLTGAESLPWIRWVTGEALPSTLTPEMALLSALDQAATAGRLGETVLLSLLLLGESGPGASQAISLAAVLKGLMAVGLEREARVLAMEAAVAWGL